MELEMCEPFGNKTMIQSKAQLLAILLQTTMDVTPMTQADAHPENLNNMSTKT